MKKTYRFLLAAGIMLAMAFTLSCSDDKDEDEVQSCSVSGTLDGTWQKSPNTFKIEGCTATWTDPDKGTMEGPITYDASKGSLNFEKMMQNGTLMDVPKDKQLEITFSYTLSGNTLAISSGSEDPKKVILDGTWTK